MLCSFGRLIRLISDSRAGAQLFLRQKYRGKDETAVQKRDLLEGKVSRVYFRYLIPTILGMLSQSLYCLVDVMVIGVGVGSDGLTALNLVMPIYTIFTAVGLLLGIGGATTMSIYLGQGNTQRVPSVFTLSILCNLLLGIGITLSSTFFAAPFARLLGSSEELLPLVLEYLVPVSAASWAFILSSSLQIFVRNDHNPRLAMAAVVAGNVLNIILDFWFVFGLGWGVFGASLATAISPIVTTLLLCLHFFTSNNTLRLTRRFLNAGELIRILKNGSSAGLLELTSGFVIYLFNAVLLRVGGTLSVAVYAIISNIAYVCKGIYNGIAQAMQPLVSVNCGAGNLARMQNARRLSQLAAAVFSIAATALCLFFPEPIIAFFAGDDRQLIAQSIPALQLYFASLLFTGANTMYLYYFQSSEKSGYATAICTARGIVLLVLGLMLLTPLLGVNGVWLTVLFAEGGTLLLSLGLSWAAHRKPASQKGLDSPGMNIGPKELGN